MTQAVSSVAKRQLGMFLRQRREDLKIDRADAATALQCSPSKISRIESGHVSVSPLELRALLDLFKVAGQERVDLERLGAQGRTRRKPTTYGPALPDWFRRYVSLEEGATELRSYETELVPGLAQIEPYTRALTLASPLPAPGDVESLVQARMARQALLTAGDVPIKVWWVLSEAVLRRQVGGPDVQRQQLARLRELADLPNVTIQISTFVQGAHAATGFQFTLLKLPNSDVDVVYLEDATTARYVDNDPAEQQRYALLWSHLTRSGALSPEVSADLLDTLIEEP